MSKTKIDFQAIANKVTPYANKFSNHKWVKAISYGLMFTIPFTLMAAIFTIIATPPVTDAILAQGGWYASLMRGWYNFAVSNHDLLFIPANMTTGLLSVIAVVGISFRLASDLKIKNPLTSSLTALIMFLIVSSPMTTAYLAATLGGATDISGLPTSSVLDVSYLGSQGLFVAMIVGILSVEITNFCIKKNLTIKMPESIPDAVAGPFNSLIPALINIVVFFGLSIVVKETMGTSLPALILKIVMPAVSNVNTYWGITLVFVIANLLWFFGVHGAAVTMMLYIPMSFQLTAQNAGLVASGSAPIWQPIFISGFSSAYIGLNIAMLLFAKSSRLKAVSKISLVPNLFNINEPIIFGAPLIFNPILIIPAVFAPVFQMTIAYFLGKAGLLVGSYNLLFVNLPLGLNNFFATMSVTTLLFTLGIQLLGTLVWIPFVKLYDKQVQTEEAQTA